MNPSLSFYVLTMHSTDERKWANELLQLIDIVLCGVVRVYLFLKIANVTQIAFRLILDIFFFFIFSHLLSVIHHMDAIQQIMDSMTFAKLYTAHATRRFNQFAVVTIPSNLELQNTCLVGCKFAGTPHIIHRVL